MDCTQMDDVQRAWLEHRFKAVDAAHPAVKVLRASVEALIASGADVVRTGWSVSSADAVSGIPRLCSMVPLPPESDGCKNSPDLFIKNIRLPALPAVFYKLQQQLEDPNISADDIAWTISMDPKLTASLLRLVNSPLFGFKTTVETVSRAVAVLGAKRLSTLATGTLLLGLFHERPPQATDIDEFWRHSVACGLAARTIGGFAGRGTPERLFVGGLLHDIGWLALCCARPDLACAALRESTRNGDLLYESEKQVIGFDHGALGLTLATEWNLPPAVRAAIAWHHSPGMAYGDGLYSDYADDVAIVHVADVIVHGMGASISGDLFVPQLDAASWERLNMQPEDVDVVVSAVASELQITLDLLQAR